MEKGDILPDKFPILPEKGHIWLALRCDAFQTKCDTYPAKCDTFPAKYMTPSGKPLALRISNNLKLCHYQKRVEKTINTIRISEIDLICG